MQSIRIGAVEVESQDPLVTKVLAQLKKSGLDVSSPDAIATAAGKMAMQANKAYSSGDKDLAEDLAHRSQAAFQASITLRKVDKKLLKEPKAVLIDAGATKLQHAVDAPVATVTIPPPAELKLPPGPGDAPLTIPTPAEAPTTTAEAAGVTVGISTGTILGVGAAAAAVAWLWWRSKKSTAPKAV
jgi:hypothetical protein